MDLSEAEELLGLSAPYTEEQVKTAYRKLALKHHPDRNKSSESSTDMMQRINVAYDTLLDALKPGSGNAKRTKRRTTTYARSQTADRQDANDAEWQAAWAEWRAQAEKMREAEYVQACAQAQSASTVEEHRTAAYRFRDLDGYKDSESRYRHHKDVVEDLLAAKRAEAEQARSQEAARNARLNQLVGFSVPTAAGISLTCLIAFRSAATHVNADYFTISPVLFLVPAVFGLSVAFAHGRGPMSSFAFYLSVIPFVSMLDLAIGRPAYTPLLLFATAQLAGVVGCMFDAQSKYGPTVKLSAAVFSYALSVLGLILLLVS